MEAPSGAAARTLSAGQIIRSYEDLEVYQRGMELLKRMHDLALRLPDYERYGLADQIWRASKSIPANIAEGYAKKRFPKVFRSHLVMAMGSANEMVVHLKIARKLDYAPSDECDDCIGEYEILGRQLNVLATRWRDIGDAPPRTNLQQPGDQP